MAIGDEICLEGLDEELARRLARGGITVKRGVIRVEDAASHDAVLLALHDAGCAFLLDHRQGWSPADQIQELLERTDGRSTPPTLCAFDGSDWLVWSG
jgi:hypothetical protein